MMANPLEFMAFPASKSNVRCGLDLEARFQTALLGSTLYLGSMYLPSIFPLLMKVYH